MRTVGVVTAGRSDYGIAKPILRAIQDDPTLQLHLIVSGAHLLPEFGRTVRVLEEDGWPIGSRVELPLRDDSPAGIAASMGVGVRDFAKVYAQVRPDVVLVLCDRFEMHAAALAALPFTIPVAHIHGGERTEGAFDDALRHSITKLSHLHFVATEEYARRVIQMGEEPWRVVVSGPPSLDHLQSFRPLTHEALQRRFGVRFDQPPLLVTYHPVTLEYERAEWQVGALLAALERIERPFIFTMPNADTNSRIIARKIKAFIETHPNAQLVDNFGPEGYFSMMTHAAAMVGNSSSGIVEAPSFRLPVVNIGTRQQGRVRAANVIDVGYDTTEIIDGITRALAPAFRESLRALRNPYGEGQAARVIVSRLREVPLDDRLIRKRFSDSPGQAPALSESQVTFHAS